MNAVTQNVNEKRKGDVSIKAKKEDGDDKEC